VTSGDDFDVRGPQLDDRGAEALLSGASSDVPDSWSGVARHLDVLRALPAAAPPGEELLDRMQAAVGTPRRRPAPTLRFRPRFVAVGMAGIATLLLSFGGLAAANALPSGVQRFVSDTLDHVGISVPSPADHGSTPSKGSNHGPGGHGPGASTPAQGKGDQKGKGDKTGQGAQNGNGAGNPSSTAPAPPSTPGSPGSSVPGSTPGATAPRGSSATAPGQTGAHGNAGNGGPGQNNAGGNAGANAGGNSQGNGGAPPSTTGNGATKTLPTRP
jgi:hypothetical protein